MKTELINLEEMNLQPAALFVTGGLDDLLNRIESDARSLVPNTKTAKGRKEIASNAARIPRSKVILDELGKKLNADLKRQTAAVDVERKMMRDRLDALKVEVRGPLTAWEDAEKARVASIVSRIDAIKMFTVIGGDDPYTAAQLAHRMELLEAIDIDESFAEFAGEAAQVKRESIINLKVILGRRQTYEEEQAELDRLRKEKEERAEADRVEQIKREATAKAQKAADERAEKVRNAAAEQSRIEERRRENEKREIIRAQEAETARLNAEHRAAERRAYEAGQQAIRAAHAAQDRAEEDQRKEADAIKKREADKVWRAKVEDEVLVGLTTFGLSIDQAKVLIVGIRLGQVPNVNIQY